MPAEAATAARFTTTGSAGPLQGQLVKIVQSFAAVKKVPPCGGLRSCQMITRW